MHVGALEVDLHIPASGSRKDKRAVVRHIVDTARARFGVSASEIGHHDLRQRTLIGFAYVAPTPGRVTEVLDEVERFVWAQPDIDVSSSTRHWLDPGD